MRTTGLSWSACFGTNPNCTITPLISSVPRSAAARYAITAICIWVRCLWPATTQSLSTSRASPAGLWQTEGARLPPRAMSPGVLRSLDYAAMASSQQREKSEKLNTSTSRALFAWREQSTDSFLSAYQEAMGILGSLAGQRRGHESDVEFLSP